MQRLAAASLYSKRETYNAQDHIQLRTGWRMPGKEAFHSETFPLRKVRGKVMAARCHALLDCNISYWLPTALYACDVTT